MKPRIVVIQSGEFWELRTSIGNCVGQRMLSVKAEDDEILPEIPKEPFRTKLDADRSALKWNLYLKYASQKKKRNQKRERISE